MKGPFVVLGYVFKVKLDIVALCFSSWVQAQSRWRVRFYQSGDLQSVYVRAEQLRIQDGGGFWLIVEFTIGKGQEEGGRINRL